MTISKYVSDFLNLYETIKIDTNHVAEGSDKYGLFKSPARDKVTRVDGSTVVTEYFQLYVSQNSISEAERKEDDQWLEEFIYWLDDYPIEYEYPTIDGGRVVTDISAGGCPTPMTNNDNGIMYQIQLKITYEREVN